MTLNQSSSRLRLSVFLANYNHGRYLRRCLDSIVLQTRPPDQLVIVDDASTDDSREIIAEYAKRYSFIEVYLHEKNQGANAAVKNALERVYGEYLYGVAADDYVLPGWFERMMEGAARYPEAGIVFGNSLITNENKTRQSVAEYRPDGEPILLSKDRFWEFVVQENYYTYISAACLYRKAAWERVGGFRPEMGHYCDNFALNTIGMIDGGCHVAFTGHAFVQYEGSFSAKQLSDTAKLLDIAGEVAYRLTREPFCAFISKTRAEEWAMEMKRRAIRTPVWKEVIERVIVRQKREKEMRLKGESGFRFYGWWIRSRIEGVFWNVRARGQIFWRTVRWALYQAKIEQGE